MLNKAYELRAILESAEIAFDHPSRSLEPERLVILLRLLIQITDEIIEIATENNSMNQ